MWQESGNIECRANIGAIHVDFCGVVLRADGNARLLRH